MTDRQPTKKLCCDVWRTSLKWHSTHLPFVSPPPPSPQPSLCCLCVCSRCWGGRGEISSKHSATTIPGSWAVSGLVLQRLPLLWQVLPHLPSPESPSADTHRSVHQSLPSHFFTYYTFIVLHAKCTLLHALTSLLGARLTYWWMNIGLVTYWSHSLCYMMDMMQSNQFQIL